MSLRGRWWILAALHVSFTRVDASHATAERVAIVRSVGAAAVTYAVNGFRTTLSAATEAERRRVAVEEVELSTDDRKARGQLEGMKSNLPRVIAAFGARAALLARAYLPEVPLAYALVVNPKNLGIRGPNVAGVRHLVPIEERLAALLAVAPRARRIGVVYSNASVAFVNAARVAAARSKVKLLTREVKRRAEVSAAFEAIAARVDALWLTHDPVVVTRESFDYLLTKSFEKRLPVLAFSRAQVAAGALVSLSPNHSASGRTAALLVLEILRNGRVTPREEPAPSILHLNHLTAARQGVTIPPAVKARARLIP